MKTVAIAVGKGLLWVGHKVKKGTALPGEKALQLSPKLLSQLKLPPLVIAVTGISGKTSTAATITAMLERAGKKVAYNKSGANLTSGIATLLVDYSNLAGEVQADALVMEIDERYTKEIFKYFKPNYLVVTNLSRDQMARSGHVDIVYQDIKREITPDMHLILNADDPIVMQLALDFSGQVTTFGLAKTADSYDTPYLQCLDMNYCPLCNSRLEFDFYHYGNIGHYHCPTGDYQRPKVDYEAVDIDLKQLQFTVNGDIIKIPNDILYQIYNNLAVYTMGSLLKLPTPLILESIRNMKFVQRRFDYYRYQGHDVYLMVSKNENPMSYNQSLSYVQKDPEIKTIIIGFENLSRRYDMKDLSWLYDIEFERLKNIDRVIIVGEYCYDIAMRLQYAGIDVDKMVPVSDTAWLFDLLQGCRGTIYGVVYFDLAITLRKMFEEVKA